MEDFDYDGFFDGEDALDDGFDHLDDYLDGFQEFDPSLEVAD